MEKFNHLFTIMYKKVVLLGILICGLLLFGCDKEKEEVVENCVVTGNIISIGIQANGIKVTLENVSDSSLKYVAISDANGTFEFRDIVAGTYYVDAVKDGLEWGWMKDESAINQGDRLLELKDDQIKELTIYMTGNSYRPNFHLTITGIDGGPISNRIFIPKHSTTVAFRLYNGTNSAHSWAVYNTNTCFVSDDIGYNSEQIFSSFSQTSGTLKPGDAIVLVGTINQGIFSVFQRSPRYKYSTLNFHSDFTGKDVYLDIEF